ncbi:MAG: cytochrome C oxidase subunit IV family protein, partial [Planctomycetota bacterium]
WCLTEFYLALRDGKDAQAGVWLALAAVKASLVAVYFMHLRVRSRVVWVFAATGFFWLGILIALIFSDYGTRGGSGVVLAFQDPVPEADVVILKDGTARPGFVVEENADGVVMDVLLKGPKGETAGVARLTVPRQPIASIRRASEEQRARTLERMAAFRSRGRAAAEAVAAVRLAFCGLRRRGRSSGPSRKSCGRGRNCFW